MLDEQEVILRSAELLGDSVVVGWVPGEQVSLAGSGWGGRSVLRDTVRVAIPVSRLMVPARRIDMGATALVGMGSLLGAFFLSMLIECGMFGC